MPGFLSRLFGKRERDAKADPGKLARTGSEVQARLEANPAARARGGRRADLFVVREFLTPRECQRLVRMIDSEIGPSTLFADAAGTGIRTSSTHYFAEDNALVRDIGARIDELLGLDRALGETLQGQRYLPGQEYRHHCDFFRTEREHWQRERLRGGQRSWSAMVYLNAVAAGGATDFPQLDLTIAPEPGMLVTWNNMTRSGRPNLATRHAGMPVAEGFKYVVTQWYRLAPWTRHQG